MSNRVFAAAVMTLALAIAAPARNVAATTIAATTIAPPPAGTVETTGLLQRTTIFCGPFGCGPIWPGPRRHEWNAGAWGPVYRPACPFDYYYACRRGPLGYKQCACWPYWSSW
jgi:hypothetical protein